MRSLVLAFALSLLTAGALTAGTIAYTYDDAGRLARVVYPDGTVIAYTWDAAGNLLRREVTGGASAGAFALAPATAPRCETPSLLAAADDRDFALPGDSGGVLATPLPGATGRR